MNIIMGRTSCSVFLSLLVLSSFVAEIHGSNNKQVQALNNLHKSKFRARSSSSSSSQDVTHRSEFEVEELHNYDDVIDSQEGLKEKDRILRLPGQPQVKFSQYGGYVTVDKSNGRAFYYYFVEAQNSKDTLPLLLWLNGGPGCSSLAYGAMQELGPFRVNSDGKTLYKNRYSWNYAANVLFLESPTGVGFSYSNTTSDYKTNGDKKTAADNYLFLVNWLERFPEYKDREFYISGESYAGHYVPQLAHTILYHNKRAKRTIINLKGILIGNAVINDDTDNKGMYDFLATHAIISDQTASDIEKFCDFSSSKTTSECDDASYEADKNIYYIDLYNIYAPDCKNNNLTAYPKKPSIVTDPCSESYVHAYMNREDVQEALHANVTKLVYDWELCSNVIGRWGDSSSTVLPLLHEFLNNNLRVWIFSGDIDGRVPVTSTKYSIKKMNLPIKTKWHAWFAYGEVGGYTEVYKGGLTLATVRGAGHQVPSYQPARALSLIMHFLNGTPLPDTKRYQ
ncbi:serine carboxypeptidase-like 40 [Arachis stenosperma]|uniref:serine carboxypeptidase-like 40 n=1 Tax=Arachis stenosperma TaxID=217475 RepID=UPI0025AC9D96|nr:serine carboxypeptidase-like 40 [Arachis stenosperma]